jgi:hypothetical protein
MLAVSLKIPPEDGVDAEDYSHLCYEDNKAGFKLPRSYSNPDLLTLEEFSSFRSCVMLGDDPWKEDLIAYPTDAEDVRNRPDIYNFTASDLGCKLRRTRYYTWQGVIELPERMLLTDASVKSLSVHGGAMYYRKRRLVSFDCSHGSLDISPIETFARSELLKMAVGDEMEFDMDGLLPHCCSGLKTYKAYSFAKRQLESLASQLSSMLLEQTI